MDTNTRCIIEARSIENGHTEWDSDYVGNESYTLADARSYLAELENDPEWAEWEFRILADDGNGCYCVEV